MYRVRSAIKWIMDSGGWAWIMYGACIYLIIVIIMSSVGVSK